MCSKVSDFIKNIHSITLPSSLWALHIDPKEEFIAILHVNVTCDKITIDKGVLLTCENSLLKASVSLNDEIVQIPNITSKVETISDLTALVYNLHDIKFCLNVNCLEFPECSKYVTSTESNFCDNCAFEAFNEKEDANKIQSSAFLDSINFNEPLVVQEDEDLLSYEFPPKKHTKIKEKQKKFLCTVCGKTFSCVSELKIHTIIHGDDKPFKCNICTKSFAKKYNLNVHSRVHTGERPYVCSKCGKTYSTRSNLSTHMNSAHCKEKRHPCDICKMTFVHPRLLKIHMRKHTGEKPFMCQVCGKAFSKNIHLTIHTRTHTGEKPYVCPVCGKGFTTSGNLNSHKKINHT